MIILDNVFLEMPRVSAKSLIVTDKGKKIVFLDNIARMRGTSLHLSHSSNPLIIIIIIDNIGITVYKLEKYPPVAGYFDSIKSLFLTA